MMITRCIYLLLDLLLHISLKLDSRRFIYCILNNSRTPIYCILNDSQTPIYCILNDSRTPIYCILKMDTRTSIYYILEMDTWTSIFSLNMREHHNFFYPHGEPYLSFSVLTLHMSYSNTWLVKFVGHSKVIISYR